MQVAKEVDLSEANPKRLREQFIGGLRGRNPEHYMHLLKDMGFIEHILPEGIKITWEQPQGIMRSGQARNSASMSIAPFLRSNDPDQLYQSLKKAEFPMDFVEEVNFLVRLFDPKLIDFGAIKKARRNPGSITTEFDKLLELKYLLKQTPELPSSLIVRFARHYQLPPGMQNGPFYIAAMIRYPMNRIKAGFIDKDGKPLVDESGQKVTVKDVSGKEKLHDPTTFPVEQRKAKERGQPIYAKPESPKERRIRPQPGEGLGSPTKFKQQYLKSFEKMIKQPGNKPQPPPKGKHWTQIPMECFFNKGEL